MEKQMEDRIRTQVYGGLYVDRAVYVGYRVRGVCGDGFRDLGLRIC